ncbi:hypothetical protein ACPPVO_43480 [Dactylosporangium sp. McL0621]|uniref:hypothetical protein n=1 Tax=Dactylosporangium sp. McL0621 TaxID=3415678 RepID=UPI003CED30DF
MESLRIASTEVLAADLQLNWAAVLTATAGAVAAVYLPHVLAVGGAVLGHLPGYLNDEGYANGARFALLSWLLPGASAAPVAVALLAGVALQAARTADPDRPWHAAATVTGGALLVAAPAYPWYALLLIVLVALGARRRRSRWPPPDTSPSGGVELGLDGVAVGGEARVLGEAFVDLGDAAPVRGDGLPVEQVARVGLDHCGQAGAGEVQGADVGARVGQQAALGGDSIGDSTQPGSACWLAAADTVVADRQDESVIENAGPYLDVGRA